MASGRLLAMLSLLGSSSAGLPNRRSGGMLSPAALLCPTTARSPARCHLLLQCMRTAPACTSPTSPFACTASERAAPQQAAACCTALHCNAVINITFRMHSKWVAAACHGIHRLCRRRCRRRLLCCVLIPAELGQRGSAKRCPCACWATRTAVMGAALRFARCAGRSPPRTCGTRCSTSAASHSSSGRTSPSTTSSELWCAQGGCASCKASAVAPGGERELSC